MGEGLFVFGLFFFVGGVVCGIFCMNVAQQKGYSEVSWLAGGFFFNIIALIAVAGLPLKHESAPVIRMNKAQ